MIINIPTWTSQHQKDAEPRITRIKQISLIRQLTISVNLSKIQPQRIRQLADRGNAEFLFIVFIEISLI